MGDGENTMKKVLLAPVGLIALVGVAAPRSGCIERAIARQAGRVAFEDNVLNASKGPP